jgi:hypothetical protein
MHIACALKDAGYINSENAFSSSTGRLSRNYQILLSPFTRTNCVAGSNVRVRISFAHCASTLSSFCREWLTGGENIISDRILGPPHPRHSYFAMNSAIVRQSTCICVYKAAISCPSAHLYVLRCSFKAIRSKHLFHPLSRDRQPMDLPQVFCQNCLSLFLHTFQKACLILQAANLQQVLLHHPIDASF